MPTERDGAPSLRSADLLRSRDHVDDLRLHRALKVWQEFRLEYSPEIENIGSLNSIRVAQLANHLGHSIYETLGVESEDQRLEPVSPNKLEELAVSIEGEGSKLIAIRHAEQSPPEWIFTIPRTDFRKIRMMQNPFNQHDLISNRGMAEVFSVGFGLLYLKERTGKSVEISSSGNLRALEAADIFSTMLGDIPYQIDEGLSCISYKDESDTPSVTVEQILKALPTGYMPWIPELVDELCKENVRGQKPSAGIISSVGQLFEQGAKGDENKLIVALTHSQQLCEVQRLAGQLSDSAVRYPELSMLVVNGGQFKAFPSGVLGRSPEQGHLKKKGMRRVLEKMGGQYEWYKVRRAEYETREKIPFNVSPQPLNLSETEVSQVVQIGADVTAFMASCEQLYRSEAEIQDILDCGKPSNLRGVSDPSYLFVRPDLLITDEGLSICEIETSPFGLALADLLNSAYRSVNFQTLVSPEVLKDFLVKNTADRGRVVYSQNTSAYEGQLSYIAEKLLSGDGRKWEASPVDQVTGSQSGYFYRGFYLYESTDNLFINNFAANTPGDRITPSLTPYMEEKALMALLWDKRWVQHFVSTLGQEAVDRLRVHIPPTWIVGREDFFDDPLGRGFSSSTELAAIPKPKRKFVFKKSGFGHGSSWAEGVKFLHEESGVQSERILKAAQSDTTSLYVIQEFREGSEREMEFEDKSGNFKPMRARIRLTPYFSMVPDSRGQLLAVKATGCEDTNYIHASTVSINTAVAQA